MCTVCSQKRHSIKEAVITCSGAFLHVHMLGGSDCPSGTELDPHKPDHLTNIADKHNQVDS